MAWKRKEEGPSSDRFNQAELSRLCWHGCDSEDLAREYTAGEVAWFERMREAGLLQEWCKLWGEE